MMANKIRHIETIFEKIVTWLPTPVSSRLEDIHCQQHGSVLVCVSSIDCIQDARKEFYICDAKIVADPRQPKLLDPAKQSVLIFGAYSKALKHYKVGPGDYIFVKNPIVVYEERGDITRVSIHVKPTAKQGVPEVIFIKAQARDVTVPSTTASSAQITETTPPPPNSTNNKAVTAEQDGQTSSRKEDGYPASSQDVEKQTFPTGDEDLLNVDELVAQVGSDDNRGQDVATDRENITSTPTKDAPREPANISPIPSTSKKGSQEPRPDPPQTTTNTCRHCEYLNTCQQQPAIPGPSHRDPTTHSCQHHASDQHPTSSPSGRISHPRPGAFQPVPAANQQQHVSAVEAARPPQEVAEQQITVSPTKIPKRKRRYSKLSECHINKSKYNVFAVLTEIVRMPYRVNGGKGKIVTKLKIKDESLNSFSEYRFDILEDNMRFVPSLQIGSVFRIHEMAVQVFNGVPDGRVYNGRLVTVIPGGVGSKIEPVYTNINKELTWCQQDSQRVEELRKWYDYVIKGGGKDSRIDEMNTAGTYNLYCKLVEYTVTENGQHLLRVEDGTISSIYSVEHPDEESQDVFGNDKSSIDIYLVEENIINRVENMRIESGFFLYLENIVCTESDAMQSQDLLPPLKIFKFTLDREGRVTIPNTQSTQCVTLRERLGEDLNTSHGQDSYINRVLALAKDGKSISHSRITMSSTLSQDSARKTSPDKENKSSQTPPKTRTASQAVQTYQDLDRLPTKRGLCFDNDESNPQNKRRKQNVDEQEEIRTSTDNVRPGEANTAAVAGRAKGFLDESASPAKSKSTDESSVLPPGQWSYQRGLRRTPIEGDSSTTTSKETTSAQSNSGQSDTGNKITPDIVDKSDQHETVVDNVSPIVSDLEDDGQEQPKNVNEDGIEFRESCLPLVPYTQSQWTDTESQQFQTPPTSPNDETTSSRPTKSPPLTTTTSQDANLIVLETSDKPAVKKLFPRRGRSRFNLTSDSDSDSTNENSSPKKRTPLIVSSVKKSVRTLSTTVNTSFSSTVLTVSQASRELVSPTESTSHEGVSSPASVYSSAPEGPAPPVLSPRDSSVTSPSSYQTVKSSPARSNVQSPNNLPSVGSGCVSPLSETCSQSSYHTVISTQEHQNEQTLVDSEDTLNDSDVSLKLRTPQDKTNENLTFVVPERAKTPRTSTDSAGESNETGGGMFSIIWKMLTPHKNTENKGKESEMETNDDTENAASESGTDHDETKDTTNANEPETLQPTVGTSKTTARRRRSSMYDVPKTFKEGDNLNIARRILKITSPCFENDEEIPQKFCAELKNEKNVGPFILICRIKEISFPYGDEATMCQICGGIHPLQALRKGKKMMRCTECEQGKPGDIKKIMFFKIEVEDHTESLELTVKGEQALQFCGDQFRQSTDSYFSDLKDSLVEVGILKDESDYVVRQSTPNFEAWKKDNLYDHMYQDGSPSKLTIITDDED